MNKSRTRKTKKSKGFTLIELIAVIVILGVVISMASLSIISISNNVKVKNYNSLIKRIEATAEKFSSDTGVLEFTVQTLIDESYLEPDDNKNIYDPRDGKTTLNCHMILVDDNGEATYDETSSNNCEYDLTKYTTLTMYYKTDTKDEIVDSETWFNELGELHVGHEFTLGSDATYSWITPYAPDISITTPTYEIKTDTSKKIKLEINNNGKTYVVEKLVNVDLTKPTIEATVENNDIWTQSKTINITLSDNLSGIAGYIISDNEKDTNFKSIENKPKNINLSEIIEGENLTFAEKTYYIHVKDVAGNINTKSIVVKKMDNTPPTINITNSSNEEITNKDVILDISASDNESGIDSDTLCYYYDGESDSDCKSLTGVTVSGTSASVSKTWSEEINHTIYVKGCNNAGKCNTASTVINIDKTGPTVKITNSSKGNKTTKAVILTANIEDAKSNIDANSIIYYYNGVESNGGKDWDIKKEVNGKKATVSGKWTAVRNATVYIKACDVLGNCNYSTTKVYIVKACSSSNPTACEKISLRCRGNTAIYSDAGRGSGTYGTLSYTATIYYIYSYGTDIYVYTPGGYYTYGSVYHNYGYIHKGCINEYSSWGCTQC